MVSRKPTLYILICLVLISLISAQETGEDIWPAPTPASYSGGGGRAPVSISANSISGYSVIDTLEQGAVKKYILNNKQYEVEVIYIGTVDSISKVKFKVNGAYTTPLIENESYKPDEHTTIKVININEEESGEVTADSTTFKLDLESYCGDNICDSNEDCSSCSADCGCSPSYKCKDSKCIPFRVCGDSICDEGENCEKDKCCNGKTVNLNTDENNCDGCGLECDNDEKCYEGLCIAYCGNGHCDGSEDCDSCIEDCRCRNGFECISNECRAIKLDECSINFNCDDSKFCTEDICSGSPKQCSHIAKEGCESDNCVPKSTLGLRASQPVYCDGNDWIAQKETGEKCENNYECKINSCIDSICKQPEPEEQAEEPVIVAQKSSFQKFFEWIFNIFG